MSDITRVFEQTEREIGSRRVDTTEATGTVVLRRRYDAPIEDVWDACTDPDRLRRWFLPVSGDLRVGGKYQLEGNAGGEILACEPPRRLQLTWVYGDQHSEVELRLSAAAAATLLELEHAGLPDGSLEGVGSGWDPALWALELYLRGELPDDLADRWRSGEFPPEVQEFLKRSVEAWTALVADQGGTGDGGTAAGG
jgi:uncharacterized protein YndB with AHSA1/START domain